MRWLMVTTLLTALHIRSISQAISVDTSAGPAFKNAVAFYNNSFGPELHLFNGKEYYDYRVAFNEGHPYFFTPTWSKGTVNYEGNRYENVSILYNLVTDQVVILNYSRLAKIQLVKERVASFALSGHSFIHIRPDSLLSPVLREGFYDILADGKITLLARRTKNIQTYTKQVVETKVFSKDHFYVENNNVYSEIDSKRALLKQVGDKRKEIQQFIKQNKISYRKSRENAMVRIVEYYNQLIK